MKKLVLAALLASAFVAPTMAQTAPAAPEAAPAPAPTPALTGNFGVASQYVFRGLTQTDGKPAVQGGLDYAHSSGLYVGTWLSNISWFTDQNASISSTPRSLASPGGLGAPYAATGSNSASLEWDLYGGFKSTFAEDWSYDVGVISYYYPGKYQNLGAYKKPNTTEVYGAIGYKWLTLKYNKAVSSDTFGVIDSKGANYIDLSAAVPVGESGYTVLAHVGHQDYPGHANPVYWGSSGGNNNFFDYTDYKLGVTKEFYGFTYGLNWTYADTKRAAPDGETTAYENAYGNNIGRNRVALTVTKTF